LAKTLHRPAILGGFGQASAMAPISSGVSPSLAACWSRKLPVPAAQMELVAKSSKTGPPEPS
jgi:hypothetical protein